MKSHTYKEFKSRLDRTRSLNQKKLKECREILERYTSEPCECISDLSKGNDLPEDDKKTIGQ